MNQTCKLFTSPKRQRTRAEAENPCRREATHTFYLVPGRKLSWATFLCNVTTTLWCDSHRFYSERTNHLFSIPRLRVELPTTARQLSKVHSCHWRIQTDWLLLEKVKARGSIILKVNWLPITKDNALDDSRTLFAYGKRILKNWNK